MTNKEIIKKLNALPEKILERYEEKFNAPILERIYFGKTLDWPEAEPGSDKSKDMWERRAKFSKTLFRRIMISGKNANGEYVSFKDILKLEL